MRPVELELAAFRSYDRETVDWREHGLVVISGDTGSGKSSLLDAISFALYARTPEGVGPRDLLTLGREHGEVRLTFAMDGDLWRVTRRYGRGAPEPGHLLERLGPDGPLERLAGEAAVNERLRALIGLGFDAFTSAVLLAQGRFARFLTETKPAQRDATLREIFGVGSLEGARLAASAERDAAEREAERLASERLALPAHAARERWPAARGARDAASRRAALRALAPLAAAAGRAEGEAAAMRDRAVELRSAAEGLPDAGAREDLAARVAEAASAATAAARGLQAAAADLEAGRAARDGARRRHGGTAAELAALGERAAAVARLRAAIPAEARRLSEARDALAEREARHRELAAALEAAERERAALERRAAALDAVGVAAERARRAAARLEEAVGGHAAGREAAAAAAERVGEARRELQRVRDGHAAAHLRAGLSPGDPCPVCGSEAGELRSGAVPPADAAEAALAAAERAGAAALAEVAARSGAEGAAREEAVAAERALTEAVGEARDAGADLGGGAAGRRRLDAELAALREEAAREAPAAAAEATALADRRGELREAERRLGAERAELAELEGQLGRWADDGDPPAALAAALREVGAAEGALEGLAEAERGAAEAARIALAALGRLQEGEVAALRQAAALLAERVRVRAPDPALAAPELIAACADLEARAARRAADAARGAERAGRAAEALREELVDRGGPDDPAALPALVARADALVAETRARHLAGAEAARQAGRLRRREAVARAEAARLAQVAADLRANQFPRYLLQRYRSRLAVGASARLQELSSGAYRFAAREPDPLAVVDLRRGERARPASTLSGGERFLASLALALGLADVAAESGGRLDCLFLDEGFSTLDAESLEQALCGVERLADDGRLIGVITHLPGVAERLGAAIRVTKDAEGRSRVLPAGTALAGLRAPTSEGVADPPVPLVPEAVRPG
jgi:DNA repair protein SbcC/Rad50